MVEQVQRRLKFGRHDRREGGMFVNGFTWGFIRTFGQGTPDEKYISLVIPFGKHKMKFCHEYDRETLHRETLCLFFAWGIAFRKYITVDWFRD